MNNSSLIIFSFVIALASLGLSATAVIIANKSRFWRKLFKLEQEPENLEEIIHSIAEKIKHLRYDQNQNHQSIEYLNKTLQTAIQFVAVNRFDSSSDDGGNLSFCLAMLDGNQTGIIITSLHGRQQNRIYCKQVVSGQAQQTLSEEEQTALIDALTSNKQKSKIEDRESGE